MLYHTLSVTQSLQALNVNSKSGLSQSEVTKSQTTFGSNVLSKTKPKTFFQKVLSALLEPMLIILLFSFVIAFGISLGKFFKSGESDFGESLGILFAIVLSVSITLIMEGSSERAFSALQKLYDNLNVKVIRNGELIVIPKTQLVVGDIVVIDSGDKILADGRLIESDDLSIDESPLTGESYPVAKKAETVLPQTTPLADRCNMVFSGTFVASGKGKMLVTNIGDNTEIGRIASELKTEKTADSPLQLKLAKLGKTVTIIGSVCAVSVLIINMIRLVLTGNLTFSGVQDLFVSCIILIVAAVPEGLPTIVAISLALNMTKLAKQNALIKKMIACETAGAVSVICTDKTGTLTQNQMKVLSVCLNEFCLTPEKINKPYLIQNFLCNNTAQITENGKGSRTGSGTELALVDAGLKSLKNTTLKEYRDRYPVISTEPFSSQTKIMKTTIASENINRVLLKGAPEKVLKECNLTTAQINKVLKDIAVHQSTAKRVLCFAHDDGNGFIYDGYAVMCDGIRNDVRKAVTDCTKAGIKIKILTGDNHLTAFAVAKELGVSKDISEVILGSDIEKLDDQTLKKVLQKITVVARSTPKTKLRIVRALKEMGEVVAVTGDGINDAPAIKHADIGIAMGKSGSEITKESADLVLLDDGFSTIVKAISFGRSVFVNLQRFIMFQLTVNLSALFFITVCALMNLPSPFNTLQLLWINVIMDGPPALSLGLEKPPQDLLECKPVKKEQGIVSPKMFFKIIFGGLYIGGVMLAQYTLNFLGVMDSEKSSTIFTLFITFQLLNAFNARELGGKSILKGIGKNKIMAVTFFLTFVVQVFIVEVCSPMFGVNGMTILTWLKTLLLSSTIIVVSELIKWVYNRAITFKTHTKKEPNANKKLSKSIN